MLKMSSDRLKCGDVIRCKAFRHAYWHPSAPNVAIVRITESSISTRGDLKAAGDPARAKRWYEVVELRRDGDGLLCRVKALVDSGARDAQSEMLEFSVPNGGIINFRYRGRMSDEGTQIVYTIPPAGTS